MTDKLISWIKTNKKAVAFILKMLLLYSTLQLLYDYVIIPYTTLDFWLINSIIDTAEYGLVLLGYDLIASNSLYQYHMGIANTSGVIIGHPCDGLSLFILFTAFVAVFKGKWWFKTIFILLGILLIHFLNVIRVIGLAVIVKYFPDTLDFHHSYTFTLFVYTCIFILWMFRIKVYQKKGL